MCISNRHILTFILCLLAVVFFKGLVAAKGLDYHIISAFPTPGPNPNGLAWDGAYLWVGDAATDSIYKLDPKDGSVILSFPSPTTEPRGLTWDGSRLILVDDHDVKIHFLSSSGESIGSVLSSFDAPTLARDQYPRLGSVWGIAWDGEYLWSSYYAGMSSKIVRLDPETGETDLGAESRNVSWFDAIAHAFIFDGEYFWIAQQNTTGQPSYVRKTESNGLSAGLSFETPGSKPTGLTFDGTHFWLTDCLLDSIYQLEIYTVGIEESNNKNMHDQPFFFALNQNYPNPFNPVTTITYSISKPEHVVIEVFGINGQKVSTLVNGFVQSGTHSIRFDASNLASGVYFYRLKTPSFSKTGKMLMVR